MKIVSLKIIENETKDERKILLRRMTVPVILREDLWMILERVRTRLGVESRFPCRGVVLERSFWVPLAKSLCLFRH